MKINVLPREIFTQISAGEVVENPRSIVKELTENSIDAGATSVAIYIEDGGLKSITVVDNGCGIENSELEKAFLPHATSKIYSEEDLTRISTLGFRGEALASISAVAEVNLSTHNPEDEIGSTIVVKGGEIIERTPSSIEKGTSITVTNLFYNTPARYKFLKSAKSEESAVTQAVNGLVLAHSDISIEYYVDGKLKLFSSEIGLKSAAEAVFGKDFEEKSVYIENIEDDVSVEGYISTPELTKGNKSSQYLIINGRTVADPNISAVVQNAYGSRLMTRAFPLYCVSVTIPIEDVDVNVHPNKSEVRLAYPRRIHGMIYQAVKRALDVLDAEKSFAYREALSSDNSDIKTDSSVFGQNPIEKSSDRADEKESHSDFTREDRFKSFFDKYSSATGMENDTEDIKKDSFDISNITGEFIAESNNYVSDLAVELNDDIQSRDADIFSSDIDASYKIVGQLFDTYLVLELKNEVYLIDQHAAHERIRFDELVRAFDETIPSSQLMLFSYTQYLDENDLAVLRDGLDDLTALGFDIKIDEEKVVVTALPSIISDVNLNQLLLELISELRGLEKVRLSSVFKHKLATAACRSAIKGGDTLTDAQIEQFIRYYKNSGSPIRCPHGRPTVVRVTKAEIEKLFKRIV